MVFARFHATRVMKVMGEINESEMVVTTSCFKMSFSQRAQELETNKHEYGKVFSKRSYEHSQRHALGFVQSLLSCGLHLYVLIFLISF